MTDGATSPYEVRVFDLDYLKLGGRTFLARVYQPLGEGRFPALLDVHGGAWNAGTADRTTNALIARSLAARGAVVVSLDFREAPQHPYPASVADVNYGTRWLKAHAAELGAEPGWVGGLGTSSGGHLAVLSALRPRDPRYAATPLPEAPQVDATLAFVIAPWPILDPYARYHFAKQTGRANLVAATERYFLTEAAMQEGNPTLALERGERLELPPVLILQGTADTNVTLAMQERFVRAYHAAGGEAELAVFPEMPHGFARSPGPETERALGLMWNFIARHAAIPGRV